MKHEVKPSERQVCPFCKGKHVVVRDGKQYVCKCQRESALKYPVKR